ncbi:MAG: SusC/RagA family TonB-linked outer membrane protein [Citrobacter freundii]|nr:MAG: SusC/RagA family TonB-linked outer membrane protein [Citrobacter freundii]
MRLFFTQTALTIVLLLAALMCRAQGQSSILDKTITVSFVNYDLKKVIDVIQAETKIKFMYSPNAINLKQFVSLEAKDIKLRNLFEQVFTPFGIDYNVIDNSVLLFARKAATSAGQAAGSATDHTITGSVSNAEGAPLAGASVMIRSLNKGTRTDADGNFSLEVPDDTDLTLEVSYVGYVTQTITVTGNSVKITLQNAVTVNEEVVVTALGISKNARKLGYSPTNLNGNLFNQAREPNMANSLGGRVAGLNVSGVNSGPGASARILVRGISNFTSATGPMIVIDGVPMDNTQKGSAGVYGGADMGDGISSINPDDIENITILKGSTASALYGTRASNGVIQITTKSGKGAKGIAVEINSNVSFNSIIDNTDYQQVYGHGINNKRPTTLGDLTTAGLNSWGEKMDGEPVIAQDGSMHPYSPVADQQQKFYRVAPVVINTVSFVNGGESGNMRLSFSRADNQSVIPNSSLKRYTVNLNLNQNITNRLKLLLMANYIRENVYHRPFLNDMSRNPNFTMAVLPANIDPAYLQPGYNSVTGYENAMNSDGYQTNPWFAAEKFVTNTTRNRLISSTTVRYDIMKGLYVHGRLGLDLVNDGLLDIEPTGTGYKRTGGLGELSKAQTTELNADVLAGYSTKLSGDITLDAAMGGNMRKYQYEKTGTNGQQWNTPFLYAVSNLAFTNPVYAYTEKQTNSGYYTLDLSYKSWLTLSTTGRYDVFSTLPKGKRGIFTPSVSSSFIFSDLLHLPKLSYGKLRFSYAQTSGEADPYQTSVYYQIQPGTNGGVPFGNILSQTSDVKNLQPYRMKEFEVGMELKWFRNRLGLDLTYFKRRTQGELIAKTISIATGYTSSYEPLGSTENKGIELVLNGTPVQSKQFTWNVSFNLTSVNNKLVSIGDTAQGIAIVKSGEGQYRPSVGPFNNGAFVGSLQGLPIGQIMAYDYLYSKGKIVVGDNGIPVRGPLTPMGSGLPKYYGGINDEIIYRKFNFSFLVDYRFGCKVLSGTDFFSIYYGTNKSTLPGRETGVIVDGVTRDDKPNNTLVNAQNYYQGLAANISTISVFDGSFIKLRQVVLGYTLPDRWFNKSPLQSINVSFAARNLLTLLKHTVNFDPEDNFSALPGNAGLQGGGIPQTRTYGVNVNVKFKK